ncbi:MAG: hypothetical protein ACOYLH_02685 [Flavobacteriales bacterium]
MKNVLFVFFYLVSVIGYSQPDKQTEALFSTPIVNLQESAVTYAGQSGMGLTSSIMAEAGDLEKFWKKYFKSVLGFSGKRGSGWYSQLGVFSSLSSDSLGVAFKIESSGDFAQLTTVVSRNGGLLSMENGQGVVQKMEELMRKGIHDFYLGAYDQAIDSQQRYYARQQKEVASAKKEGERLARDKAKAQSDVEKLGSQIVASKSKTEDLKADKVALDKEVELKKREEEQAKKEIELKKTEIQDLETSYNQKMMANELSEKKAARMSEDIASAKEKLMKLEAKAIDRSEAISKVESKRIAVDRSIAEQESNLTKLENQKSKRTSDIESFKEKIEKNTDKVKEEETEAQSALNDLERLKAAKAAM